jgi:hypothetical protein
MSASSDGSTILHCYMASFSDQSIRAAGVGYTLHATVGGGVPGIDSDPFNITM